MKTPRLLAALLLTTRASARLALPLPPELVDEAFHDVQKRASTSGTGFFPQLLDHNDPSKGTFAQAYWWSSAYWTGPGAPVVFFTPGEIAAARYTGYLTNSSLTGTFAQAIGGAVVLMEHRYYGNSSPFSVLTAQNLTYLTLEQAIKDTTYLANTIQLPFDANGSSNARNAPWVFSGGSYSGALAGWVASVDPGTFWAYHASSAVVQAVEDFWRYFRPVQAGMPANCSADVNTVVHHIDDILQGDDAAAIAALKAQFHLGGVAAHDDFAQVLENGPWQWQSHDLYTGYADFDLFCDSVENVGRLFPNASAAPPGPHGVGLERALEGYARWIREALVPGYCAAYGYEEWQDDYALGCFDTYNATSPWYTDLRVASPINRQWMWLLCNEPFGFWQNGAPTNHTTLASRLVTTAYWQRQCALAFPAPGTNGSAPAAGKTAADINAYTGGWGVAGDVARVVWANGEWDPWREATVSAASRPGGAFEGSPGAPVNLIPGGIHCSDLLVERNGAANAGVRAVIEAETAQIKTWVDGFYAEKKKKGNLGRVGT